MKSVLGIKAGGGGGSRKKAGGGGKGQTLQ
jgi:hypothetical protein